MKAGCLHDQPPILCVIPYSLGDFDIACQLLGWIKDLGGCRHNAVMLMADCKVPKDKQELALHLAEDAFKSTVAFSTPESLPDESWPRGANYMFRTAAAIIESKYGVPFFWNEPDCIPLKAGWLEYIEEEYYSAGKSFMGFVIPETPVNGKMLTFVNGVAVYPQDTATRFKDLDWNGPEAWDILASPLMISETHEAKTIQNFWGEMGLSPTFAKFHVKGEPKNVFTLDQIRKGAVVFHRCKDGSLIDVLKVKPETPPAPSLPINDTCYVLLGRNGDLINALPIFALKAAQIGRPCPVGVSQEFLGLLEGCSYIAPQPVSYSSDLLQEAIGSFQKRFRNVHALQCWGNGKAISQTTRSYNQETWKFAGMLGRFSDKSLRPCFDARSPAHEEQLRREHIKDDRPILLMAIRGGFSSPFGRFKELEKQIVQEWGSRCQIIDLCAISQCRRLYDLLGLMDSASLLISADSAHLHLAAASNVPTVALLSNRGWWQMTTPRCAVIWQGNYDDALMKWQEIDREMKKVPLHPPTIILSKLIHVTDSHWREQPRCLTAWRSWVNLYFTNQMLSCHLAPKAGAGPKIVPNGRQLPFLKTLLKQGLEHARDEDVIVWTNSDSILEAGIVKEILGKMAHFELTVGRRVDYATRRPHPGRDLAAFRAKWLRTHWDEIPDLMCGAAEIDNWMALAARRNAGLDSSARMLLTDTAVDIAPGLLLHIDHAPVWDNPKIRYSDPSNVYNVEQLRRWTQKFQPSVRYTSQGFVDWRI